MHYQVVVFELIALHLHIHIFIIIFNTHVAAAPISTQHSVARPSPHTSVSYKLFVFNLQSFIC